MGKPPSYPSQAHAGTRPAMPGQLCNGGTIDCNNRKTGKSSMEGNTKMIQLNETKIVDLPLLSLTYNFCHITVGRSLTIFTIFCSLLS